MKYPEPRIVLIDMDESAAKELEQAGYNITKAQSGFIFDVSNLNGNVTIPDCSDIPSNLEEYDIVVVDMSRTKVYEIDHFPPLKVNKMQFLMQTNEYVHVDLRNFILTELRSSFRRMYHNKGIFIIFASLPSTCEIIINQRDYLPETREYNNWDWINDLQPLSVENSQGELMNIDTSNRVGRLLSDFQLDSYFSCSFDVYLRHQFASITSQNQYEWTSLAQNKFGQDISGIAWSLTLDSPGILFLFPQLENKGRFLTRLFNEVLPDIIREKFPHSEGANWLQASDYLLPSVKEIQLRIEEIQKVAKREVEILQNDIDQQTEQTKFMSNLLTASGDALVAAVQQTLIYLGFRKDEIIDVDKEYEAQGKSNRDEDLRIEVSGETLILVEVKGISGKPHDEDAMAVEKYIAPRMRELGRTDIIGLSIINHQKSLPALDREEAFRELIIENAEKRKFGLMTSWTLYKIARNFRSNNWTHSNIRSLFYQSGEIDHIPTHYDFVAKVTKTFPEKQVVGIFNEIELSIGDTLAYELRLDFVEQEIISLQIDDESVDFAPAKSKLGIQTQLTKEQIKQITRIYRVRKN